MRVYQHEFSQRPVEHGQSTVIIALSLGVLLLLIIGAVILCLALFTTTTIKDFDEDSGLFGTTETQFMEFPDLETIESSAHGVGPNLPSITYIERA